MYTYIRRAQYHETDQMGIIHHSNYVKWMEEARIRFLEEMGIDYRRLEESGIISPIVGISVQYKKTVRFDDEVHIGVYVKKYNGIRLELGYEMRNQADGAVCTTASSQSCFTKNGVIVSLKKERPELDAKVREYMAREQAE
ncbi:MAG TPA: acyl-CoA thioesterase [Candidatus Anaerobutyricum stercoripullorum]|uniref:Acyl-CoA thioesterase n=1 Tax=Candidatus Anaerobutyricum stercoripullorum TaxID=2838456 RepID=A0A9D1X4L4_9FIRM|nr:acyl-CoA thioesterase [Candidatus Anaerobutyricum stercoripullorum]